MTDDVEVSALANNVTIPEASTSFRVPERPEILALVAAAATRAGAMWADHRGLS